MTLPWRTAAAFFDGSSCAHASAAVSDGRGGTVAMAVEATEEAEGGWGWITTQNGAGAGLLPVPEYADFATSCPVNY